MRERKTARCSFICLRRFLSTAMCVILWVSASSLFLHTLGRRLRFLRPEGLSVSGGGGGWLSRESFVSEETTSLLLQLKGVAAAEESYMMKFKSSLEESASKAIFSLSLSLVSLSLVNLYLVVILLLLSSLYQRFEYPNTIDLLDYKGLNHFIVFLNFLEREKNF